MVLRDDIAMHRKFLLAGKKFGRGGASRALGLYIAAIGYAREYMTDGFIDDEFLTNFRQDPDAKKLAFALNSRRINLFHRCRGGYLIHDFHDYNPSKEKLKHQRELAARRKRAQRAREAEPERELVEAKALHVTHLSRRDSRARVQGKGKGEGRTSTNEVHPTGSDTSTDSGVKNPPAAVFTHCGKHQPCGKPVDDARRVLAWRRARSKGTDGVGRPKVDTIRALVRHHMAAHPDWDAVDIVEDVKVECARANLLYDSGAVYAAIAGAQRQLAHMRRRAARRPA
jgi:hypothetical protein